LLLLSWVRDNLATHTDRLLFTYTVLILLSLLYSLRFDVGPDYYNYYLYFMEVVNHAGNEVVLPRPDYAVFYLLSKFFSFSEYGYLAIFSLYASASFVLIFLAIG